MSLAASIMILNEDEADLATMSRFKGNVEITDSLANYIKVAIEKMLGLRAARGRKPRPNRVRSLLELSAEITKVTTELIEFEIFSVTFVRLFELQLTCTVVNADTIEIAMQSFFVQQRDRNHIKEPFISHPYFLRVLSALEHCRDEARAYEFIRPEPEELNVCDDPPSPVSSEFIYRLGLNISLPPIPSSVGADARKFEPIVEIAWKTFLNAHSYCYRYFSNYFNDHHFFTVAAVAYFSNKIQDSWFIQDAEWKNSSISDDTGMLVYKTDRIWYGGLLGDTGEIFEAMDRCYRASRVTSDEHPSYQYPWFMNRPPRDRSHDWR